MNLDQEKLNSEFSVSVFCALFFCFLLPSTSAATLLSDSYLGLLRPVLRDAVPQFVEEDPFQVVGNPAWGVSKSRAALSTSLVGAQMGEQAESEESSAIVAFTFQERKGSWSFGAFSVLPTGAQPVVDTGDETLRTSPWMAMSRQIVYAANLAWHSEKWSFGALVPVYFNALAEARAQLETENVNTRALINLKPTLSYAFGALYSWDERQTFSIMYKEKAQARAEALLQGNIPVLSLDLVFQGESFYSFDPRRVSVGYSSRTSWGAWGAHLRFSQWSQFQTPYVELTTSTLEIRDSSPSGAPSDAWEFTLGSLWQKSKESQWAASVAYQQSPFSRISSYYDSDQLVIGTGYSYMIFDEWQAALSARGHILNRGVFYTWFGLGLRYNL